MSDVSTTLSAFKTILATIDPSPQPAPAAVYKWPDDYASMDYSTFPFVIVAQLINEDVPFTTLNHLWTADLLFCLANGPLTKLDQAKAAEEKQLPWIAAIATVLFNNRGVGGTVLAIGSGQTVFTYRTGHIEWAQKVFWGIRVKVPIVDYHGLG